MISLRKAADKLSISLSTLQRIVKRNNFDTSKGLSDDQYRQIEDEIYPERATPQAETVDAEILNVTSIARYMPQAITKTEDAFNDPLAVVAQVSEFMELARSTMEAETETKRRQLQELQEARQRLAAQRKQLDADALQYKIDQAILSAQLGKETAEIKELL